MAEVFEKFLQLIKPINSYDDTDHPKAPDYSNLDSWAAHPDIDGYQFFVPDNNLKVNRNKNDVDVFYIHPTGCFDLRLPPTATDWPSIRPRRAHRLAFCP